MLRFVRLRAHASQGPGELFGRGGAFGRNHHGGGLMRESLGVVNGFGAFSSEVDTGSREENASK
jgi:hypothetical protein